MYQKTLTYCCTYCGSANVEEEEDSDEMYCGDCGSIFLREDADIKEATVSTEVDG